MRPLAVILAGGQASRMGGGDKCLLDVAGRPILAHLIERLEGHVDGIALNANGDPARFAAVGLPVIADAEAGLGPLGGVLAGLRWAAARGAGQIVTVAGDTPRIPRHLVPALRGAATARGRDIAMAATADGRQPVFALWPTRLAGDLADALAAGARKIVAWADAHDPAIMMFDGGFENVNTPGDLAELRAAWP